MGTGPAGEGVRDTSGKAKHSDELPEDVELFDEDELLESSLHLTFLSLTVPTYVPATGLC